MNSLLPDVCLDISSFISWSVCKVMKFYRCTVTIWWVIDYDNITNSLAEKSYGENRSKCFCFPGIHSLSYVVL